ncbi:MAG: hypothetical protein N3D84_01880, partial [Candidatus Woesearchaeota archaeon]|nr:hypothetical protein [Candidatus Woesearchaeota archaeon]
HIFMVSKALSHACLRAFKAQGTNIFIANGVVAGQRAQHFMAHIIPRKDNDGINVFNIPHKKISEQQLEEASAIIKKRINEIFGIKEEVIDLDKEAKAIIKEAKERPSLEKEKAQLESKEKNIEKEIESIVFEEGKKDEEKSKKKIVDKTKSEEREEEIDIDKIAEMFK